MWRKQSSLNSCSHVYFLENVDGWLTAGTDVGVFVQGAGGAWTQDLTFTQATFDVLEGTWGGRCTGRHLTTKASR